LKQVYLDIVRGMRKSSRQNAVAGLKGSIMQTVISILAFHFIFQPIGIRTSFTTGDYMLYIISGIAMYITHNSAVMVMVGAEGPASTMLQLAPMNALISI
jgi:hypothetical protein